MKNPKPRQLLLVELGGGDSDSALWDLPHFECVRAIDIYPALAQQDFDCVVLEVPAVGPELERTIAAVEDALCGKIIPVVVAAHCECTAVLATLEHRPLDGFVDLSWPKSVIDINLLATVQRVQLGRRLAIEDDLTQLYNRRYFDSILESEHERSRRHGHAYAVVIIDLDGVKAINARHGHPAGSAIIREVGRLIKASSRRSDFAFRYGGDEFVSLLVETTKPGAQVYAERLCQRIRENRLSLDGQVLSVTASAGIAIFPEDGQSREDVFRKADQALLQAKATGKDCIVCCETSGEE